MTQKGKGSGNSGVRGDYEVGYCRPPVHSRFQPGQSGNPGGRPIGTKTRKSKRCDEQLRELVLKEAYREVTVQDGGRDIRMPVVQAALRSLTIRAAKGDARASKQFLDLLQMTEDIERERRETWLKTFIDYKVDMEREIERRKAIGITHLPDPIPHPDDILIDFENDTVTIVGPLTKEEKAARDRMIAFREDLEDELRWCVEEIGKTEDPEGQQGLQERIALVRELIARVQRMLRPI